MRTLPVILATLAVTLAVQPPPVVIDYPEDGSLFPPDFAAPTFLWRGPQTAPSLWTIEVTFADGGPPLRRTTEGPLLRIGEIDPRAVAESNRPPTLTPQQAATRTWKPNKSTWDEIKRRSTAGAVTVTITGAAGQAVSRGAVRISTSADPVGAPIFYRDVPLMPSELEKGVIKPIIPSAVPLISWRLRDVGEDASRLLMQGLPTCANCHSFSRDGKTMALDVDGPQNDKGMYAIAAVASRMLIRTQDVFTWNDFPGKPPGQRTIGFMAQLSPDGRYAITTLNEDVYVANFKDYRFLQVFYPTRGILAWYNRSTGQIRALPGADNPNFVQASAFWSPDGKYLIFARARARDAYPQGRQMAQYAGDPLETPIQYDLYRIPFNGGKGGRAQAVQGASHNGKSNSFPKVSPDGRWIVFVQSANGLLMRPDSELYIVPAAGGAARRMRANTARMNSWHSFSPNGRWLVFSSKSRSHYTQMFLTHIDQDGNDSPPLLIENATAANRAVNLPEFVNVPPSGLQNIDVPAADFYRLFDSAWSLAEKGQFAASIGEWNKALALNPGDAKAHNNLGRALAGAGAMDQAITHWQKALEINPAYLEARNNLGVAYLRKGKANEAIACFEQVLEANSSYAEVHANLGRALAAKGKDAGAMAHWRRAIELNPNYAEAYNDLGAALLRLGRTGEAIRAFQKAAALNPAFAAAQFNLGNALSGSGQFAPALAAWRAGLQADPNNVSTLNRAARLLASHPEESLRNGGEAVLLAERARRLTEGLDPGVLDTLAAAYAEAGRFSEAVETAGRASSVAIAQGQPALAASIQTRAAQYAIAKPLREAVR
ncbi:MAG: tetratricopeptide repeat protein [Acidobacteria bacterium]|nr:tetratricopeptide repeat protein [Acidobacteriota bacterium]